MEAFIEGVLIQLMETSHPLSALMNYIDIVSVTCLLMERVMNYIGFSTMYCPPMSAQVYHPLLKKSVNFAASATFQWSTDFFNALKQKRKVALRMGELSEQFAHYELKKNVLNKLLRKEISVDSLTEHDFLFKVDQKGVDMRIGLDIASLSYKKQVDQIILISGDSDFVSAAKLARREGIDFILDALHTNIKPNLFEHIDGLRTCDNAFKPKTK